MAFFRTVSFSEPLPAIEGDGVNLRAPQMSRLRRVGAACARSAGIFSRPGSRPGRRTISPVGVPAPAPAVTRRTSATTVLCVLSVPQGDDALVGGLTLANIRRGVAQAGSLGYWIGEPFARRGLMTGAVRALDAVRVRIAAAAPAGSGVHSRPMPPRSGCSRRCGFVREGMRANISASTASGRITCCLRGSMATALV